MTAKSIFESNAAKLRELHQAVQSTAIKRDKSSEQRRLWEEATQRFHDQYDLLAFPGGLEHQMKCLQERDGDAIELAVSFLEADPWFFRSGYIKEDLIKSIKKASLSESQRDRLRNVLLARVNSGSGREYRDYCKLAPYLMTNEFREQLLAKVRSQDEKISQRARWMLEALEAKASSI